MINQTSFGIDFKVNQLIKVDNTYDVNNLKKFSIDDIFVVGECTNTIFNESIDKIILKSNFNDLVFDGVNIKVGANINWHEFVMTCNKNNLYGLENLAYIPGSVGASPIQNIGAYGVEVSKFIHSVECIDLDTLKIVTLDHHECKFAYRESIFQSKKYLINTINFVLEDKFKPVLKYESLNNYMKINNLKQNEMTSTKLIEIIGSIRSSRLPNPSIMPNCGSFFKNPVLKTQDINNIDKLFIIENIEDELVKISAGSILEVIEDKINFFGNISLHQSNKLVLVNSNNCTFRDLKRTVKSIQDIVLDEFNISLQVEPILIE